ncbi:RNA polymerase sigma factor [Bacteroidota bacterium]
MSNWCVRIYAVSINTSISRLKKKSRLIIKGDIPESYYETDIVDDLSNNESLQILLKAIYELNNIDKSIMLLYLEEKTYAEIADVIGISESNVGVRINRAKAVLKQNLNYLDHEK